MNRLALFVLAPVSLVLTTTVNRAAGTWLVAHAPGWAWLADACVPSTLACLLVYLAIQPARPFGAPLPTTPWSRLMRLGAIYLIIWLACVAIQAWRLGYWPAYAKGRALVAGFVVIAPLGEEMLFRGAIYELTERVWPGAALLVSTVFFSLHHFELHGFHATNAALSQVGFAFVMGWIFGRFRRESGSLWPGLGLHVLTNLPNALGS
jgi:membrane protease YdiL (CAAX protease family)